MYVCVCKAVTERQLHQAVADGARTMRDLRRDLGVCSGCGKCGPAARSLLIEAVDDTASAEPAAPMLPFGFGDPAPA